MSSKGLKKRWKGLSNIGKIGCISGGVILALAVGLCVKSAGGKESNFYSVMKGTFGTEVGDFRYILNVRTSKHVDATADESSSMTLSELEGLTASDTQDVTEVVDSNKVSGSWGTSDNIEDVNWNYPNYEIRVIGRTESISPLKSKFTVTVSTEYVSQTLTTVTIMDDKYYIDVDAIRKWLRNAKDSQLVTLANSIPESAVYLVMGIDDIRFYSRYAEDSEYEVSGTTSIIEAYRSAYILENLISESIQSGLGKTGLSTANNKYYLSLSDDSSVSLLKVFKSMLNNAGSTYNNYVNTVTKSLNLSDERKLQAVNERDNFLYSVRGAWSFFNNASEQDLKNVGLKLVGWGREYDNKGTNYEMGVSFSFTDQKAATDYVVSFTGYKQPVGIGEAESVTLPTGATCTSEQLLASNCDLRGILMDIAGYFDVFSMTDRVTLDVSTESIMESALVQFAGLVNDKNADNGSFSKVTKSTVKDFINKYANMSDSEIETDADRNNIQLVKDFMSKLNDITGGVVLVEKVEAEVEVEQFRDIDFTGKDYRVVASVNEEESTLPLVVIDATILNTTGEDMTLALSEFSLQDLASNRYPCNYHTQLHEYDNGFDLESAPESIEIPAGGYATVKLYTVLDSGFKYLDLFDGNTKLGDIVAY